MNDRELLENAAKAAGIEIVFCGMGDCYHARAERTGFHRHDRWNPFAYDGDALRLAVKLDMNVFQAAKSAYALTYDDDDGTYEKQVRYTDTNNDPYAATRLAIVRAAAEIGKAMP